ncbi:hypothetical protein MIDIC_460007 [Alphaproteobacteria bacterium]
MHNELKEDYNMEKIIDLDVCNGKKRLHCSVDGIDKDFRRRNF